MTIRTFAHVSAKFCAMLCAIAPLAAIPGRAQEPAPANGAPRVTLEDALARARRYAGQIQSANLAVLQAGQDTFQARAARRPSVNAFNQFIYTEANGTPSGVFVANDGVHIYNEQAVVHQELLSVVRRGEVDRAAAAEAIARARVEIAARGLDITVIQDYYGILSAQRRFANAQTSVTEAQRFLEIAQQLQQGGEVARADVVKAQHELEQRQRSLQEARYAIERAKIALGVLIFPAFSADFEVVDDLDQSPVLAPIAEAQAQAAASSPDLKAAAAGIQEAGHEITVARYGYLPSLGLDVFYGINANQFAARTHYPVAEGLPYRQNLGYSAQVTLNIPVWNWGATRSKIKQAELKRDQAQVELTQAQRTLQGNLAAVHAEARAAQGQFDPLRRAIDTASEILRLTVLRYQAGEAIALEVSDAQSTVTQARNAYNDGLARYRVAETTLRSLTGALQP